MALPDPQLMADAQAVMTFANAISQCAAGLVNHADKTSPEYAQLKVYFNANMPKLKSILDRLEADLAN